VPNAIFPPLPVSVSAPLSGNWEGTLYALNYFLLVFYGEAGLDGTIVELEDAKVNRAAEPQSPTTTRTRTRTLRGIYREPLSLYAMRIKMCRICGSLARIPPLTAVIGVFI